MVPEIAKIKNHTVTQREANIGHIAASFSIIYADWGYNNNDFFFIILQFSVRKKYISMCQNEMIKHFLKIKILPISDLHCKV